MIEVADLTKVYGDVTAVDHLTFAVEPGVVTGFLGPNGAGKSTTMRMILGLDRPTEGTALISGVPYRKLKKPLTQVGTLLNAKAVHPNRSARAHLSWIAQTNGISSHRVDEVLGLVGLSDVAGKKAGGFSLGMGQRLGLAAALLGDPEVLILDEPINGLDPEGIRWMRSLLESLAQEGRTVMISSHLLSEMAQTAQNLIVIGQGQLIANTTTHDFVREHSTTTVIVRSEHLDEFKPVVERQGLEYVESQDDDGRPTLELPNQTTDVVGKLAHSAHIVLSELSERHASLEDAFLELTSSSAQYTAMKPEEVAEPLTQTIGAAYASKRSIPFEQIMKSVGPVRRRRSPTVHALIVEDDTPTEFPVGKHAKSERRHRGHRKGSK